MARFETPLENREVILKKLDDILEFELSGITRYLHYSFMVFGPNRIPITKWMHDQANDGFVHAAATGEWITSLGGHPSVKVRATPESGKHDVKVLLQEALEFECEGLRQYHELLELVKDRHVALEEWTRGQIQAEQEHVYEMEKMLR